MARLPLFAGILEQLFEKRPEMTPNGKKTIRQVLVQDVLVEYVEIYEIPAGTVLFQEGSFGEHLFILLKGQVRLSTHLSLDTERNAAVALEEIQLGDFFGEMSVLSMNAHLSTAETMTPTLLLLVPQFIVQELATAQGSFHKLIMQRYVDRTVRTLVHRIPLLRLSTRARKSTSTVGEGDFSLISSVSISQA